MSGYTSGRAAAVSVLRSMATGRKGERRRQPSPTHTRRTRRASAFSTPSVSPRGGGVRRNPFSFATQRHGMFAGFDRFEVPGARLLLPSGGSIRSPPRLLCVRDQRFDSGIAHGSSHVGSGELGFCVGESSRCSVLTGIRCRCWKFTLRCSYCVGFGFCCAENLHWKMCSISGIGCFFPISPQFPICAHRFCWE